MFLMQVIYFITYLCLDTFFFEEDLVVEDADAVALVGLV